MKYQDIHKWDEQYLIEEVLKEGKTDEYSWIDFKSSRILKDLKNFEKNIAKELSAFGNAEGGYIVIGVDDKTKEIDGGVDIKFKNGIKEWLDRKIPHLTFEITDKFDTHPIKKEDNNNKSMIKEGSAIIVIEIQPHEKAPIQSAKDNLFYLRISSQSLQMTKQQIFDIANRKVYPDIVLDNFILNKTGQNDHQLVCEFKVNIKNIGKIIGNKIGLELDYNPLFMLEDYVKKSYLYDKIKGALISIGHSKNKDFIRYKESIFPEQIISFNIFNLTFDINILKESWCYFSFKNRNKSEKQYELIIPYKLYCDSAIPKIGEMIFFKYGPFYEEVNNLINMH